MILLINWLWQGVVLTALVALALHGMRRLNAATRERVWWIVLAIVLLLPLLGLLMPLRGLLPSSAEPAITPLPMPARRPLIELAGPLPLWSYLFGAAVAAWACVRLSVVIAAAAGLRRVRRTVRPFPEHLERGLARWTSVRAGGPRIPRLVLSEEVPHAAVLGLGAPLIAISPATVARLTRDELDQVVIHEYAHVCRRDDIAVLVQRVTASAFAFHPAVWWIDRALTLEREVACDDWVLDHATPPQTYGRCLLKLSEGVARDTWSVVPGAGAVHAQLARRVLRLVDGRRSTSVRASRAACAIAAAAICTAASAGVELRLIDVGRVRPLLSSLAVTGTIGLPWVSTMPPTATAPITAGEVAASRAPVELGPEGRSEALPVPLDLSALFDDHAPAAVATAALVVPGEPAALLEPGTLGPMEPALPPRLDATDTPDDRSQDEGARGRSPWMRVADVGIAIGQGAKEAGLGTGGFFSRLGASIAGARAP